MASKSMAATMDNRKTGVEIGVLEECDSYLLESRYFPNKMGGKPAWLDLGRLPGDSEMTCGVCSKPCVFLCQVYAPLDGNPAGHHRTIFVFICRDPACCKNNQSKNLKVFRCQLPARNAYYAYQDPTEEESWHPESTVEMFSRTCFLCGNHARYNCGKCRDVSYCCREHQTLHWKEFGHRERCNKRLGIQKIDAPPLLFRQWEITIDRAPEEESEYKTEEERVAEYEKLVEEGKAGSMASTSAETMEQYAMIKDDKYFRKYRQSITDCPEQVLRFDRGGVPLYVAKPFWKPVDIPKCEYCNTDRQFEFQILSTMLNEMGQTEANSLDWGTLLVYTCKKGCAGEPAYKTEFIIKQDVSDD